MIEIDLLNREIRYQGKSTKIHGDVWPKIFACVAQEGESLIDPDLLYQKCVSNNGNGYPTKERIRGWIKTCKHNLKGMLQELLDQFSPGSEPRSVEDLFAYIFTHFSYQNRIQLNTNSVTILLPPSSDPSTSGTVYVQTGLPRIGEMIPASTFQEAIGKAVKEERWDQLILLADYYLILIQWGHLESSYENLAGLVFSKILGNIQMIAILNAYFDDMPIDISDELLQAYLTRFCVKQNASPEQWKTKRNDMKALFHLVQQHEIQRLCKVFDMDQEKLKQEIQNIADLLTT